MRLIWLPICSLLIGVLTGSIITFTVPVVIAKYLSVAILAALDSVLGGVRAILEDSFDGYIMLTGFFTNALLAAGLAFLGDKIGVDMYLAATVCFGLRLFSNLGYIRRFLINKFYDYRQNQRNQPKKLKKNKKLQFNRSSSHNQPVDENKDENIIQKIIEGNTSIGDFNLEIQPVQEASQPPAKVRAMEKFKSSEEDIQDFAEEDMKEYTKINNRKHT